MKRARDVEAKVFKVLAMYPKTREDDFLLYAKYLKENNAELKDVGLLYALTHAKNLKMPNFESITRARRKLQRKNPELSPPKQVAAARAKKETKYRAYAHAK